MTETQQQFNRVCGSCSVPLQFGPQWRSKDSHVLCCRDCSGDVGSMVMQYDWERCFVCGCSGSLTYTTCDSDFGPGRYSGHCLCERCSPGPDRQCPVCGKPILNCVGASPEGPGQTASSTVLLGAAGAAALAEESQPRVKIEAPNLPPTQPPPHSSNSLATRRSQRKPYSHSGTKFTYAIIWSQKPFRYQAWYPTTRFRDITLRKLLEELRLGPIAELKLRFRGPDLEIEDSVRNEREFDMVKRGFNHFIRKQVSKTEICSFHLIFEPIRQGQAEPQDVWILDDAE